MLLLLMMSSLMMFVVRAVALACSRLYMISNHQGLLDAVNSELAWYRDRANRLGAEPTASAVVDEVLTMIALSDDVPSALALAAEFQVPLSPLLCA